VAESEGCKGWSVVGNEERGAVREGNGAVVLHGGGVGGGEGFCGFLDGCHAAVFLRDCNGEVGFYYGE